MYRRCNRGLEGVFLSTFSFASFFLSCCLFSFLLARWLPHALHYIIAINCLGLLGQLAPCAQATLRTVCSNQRHRTHAPSAQQMLPRCRASSHCWFSLFHAKVQSSSGRDLMPHDGRSAWPLISRPSPSLTNALLCFAQASLRC